MGGVNGRRGAEKRDGLERGILENRKRDRQME